MAIVTKTGDKSKQVPASNVFIKIYRFFRSNKIHYECGGKWRFTCVSSFGHIETCEKCGEQCYESDY